VRNLRVAFGQTNPVVGDFKHNLKQIESAISEASGKADLIVFGELALCGYPLGDLSYRKDIIDASVASLTELVVFTSSHPEITVVVGYASHACGSLAADQASYAIAHNSAAVIRNGELLGRYHKQLLPNFDVFDDWRNFVPGTEELFFEVHGVKCAVAICQDIWTDDQTRSIALRDARVELVVVPNGSPFVQGKRKTRIEAAKRFQNDFMIAYSNLSGGQDELVFDGGSFILDKSGAVSYHAPSSEGVFLSTSESAAESEQELLWNTLVVGLRDYLAKTSQQSVVLGLSGGIDSALSCALAVDAVGKENVYGVALPSRYSSGHSLEDAKALADNLGVNYSEIGIDSAHKAFESLLELSDLASENIQARIRAVILMGISNTSGHLLLSTGNKSEIAVGYSTMYGDAAGGFAPIKDLYKTEVWALSTWLNESRGQELIPWSSIEKAPSAELRPGQLDQDSLPDYAVLDQVIEALVERTMTIDEVSELGFERALVRDIDAMIRKAEWKRSQGAIGTKVSAVAFGSGRRVPLTTRFEKL
jgi:NAD+ synthase (glutamine-hydrolysing)